MDGMGSNLTKHSRNVVRFRDLPFPMHGDGIEALNTLGRGLDGRAQVDGKFGLRKTCRDFISYHEPKM